MNNEKLLVLGTQKSSGKNGKSIKTRVCYAYREQIDSNKKGLQIVKEDWLNDNGKLFDILIPNKLYDAVFSYKTTFGNNAVEILKTLSDPDTGDILYSLE